MKTNKSLALLLAALGIGFGFGVAHLFRLRFETGDVYAPYSSLRADPLGTKAFYESLRNLPAVSVRRHFQALNRLQEGRDTTLFFLGASGSDWRNPPQDLIEPLETLAAGGGRVVVAFIPEMKAPRRFRREEKRAEGKESQSARDAEKPGGAKEPKRLPSPGRKAMPEDDVDLPGMHTRTVSLKDRWGVELAYRDLPKNGPGAFEPVSAVNQSSAPLPDSIGCHTALRFDSFDPAWHVIYASARRAVLIERPWRLGTLVLAADSFVLSNEAMRSERHPGLLAWLIGPSTNVVFDEAHLGIEEQLNVAALARRYRLHGLLAGLLLLAGLFVWKNSFSLVPPYEDHARDATGGLVIGQDATAGLVQLLRRNIPAREILGVCFAEWKKARAHGRTDRGKKLTRAQEVVDRENLRPSQTRDPVGSYQTISRLLAEPNDYEPKP